MCPKIKRKKNKALHPSARWLSEQEGGGEERDCNSFEADVTVKGKYFKG